MAIDENGEVQIVYGESTPAEKENAPVPKYGNLKVLAEIRRGRTNVVGSDIKQVNDGTRLGTIAASDYAIKDEVGFLPANARNIEDAFAYIMRHSIAISPNYDGKQDGDSGTQGVVREWNIKWGHRGGRGKRGEHSCKGCGRRIYKRQCGGNISRDCRGRQDGRGNTREHLGEVTGG